MKHQEREGAMGFYAITQPQSLHPTQPQLPHLSNGHDAQPVSRMHHGQTAQGKYVIETVPVSQKADFAT